MSTAIEKRAESMMERAKRAISYARNLREETKEQVGQVVQSAEIQGGAFATGLINGRFANPKLLGIPAGLGVGIVLHVAGFAGMGGDRARDLHALGDGALASYSADLGREVGAGWRRRAGQPSGGGAPTAAASGEADDALAELVRAATS